MFKKVLEEGERIWVVQQARIASTLELFRLNLTLVVIYLANLPDESLPPMSTMTQTGVYYGFAQVSPNNTEQRHVLSEEDSAVLPMVMSLGWNPFYKNKQLTAVRASYCSIMFVANYVSRKFISCMTSSPIFMDMT